MFAAIDGKPAGLLGVADPVKSTTPEAIDLLHREGLRLVMLTGDSKTTAQAVARAISVMSAGSPVICVSCQATWIVKRIRGLVVECTLKEFFRRDASRIFVVSVFLNYPWERAQSTLYRAEDGSVIPWWHCMLASLGDGLLVLLIFWAGRTVFGNPAWFDHPGLRGYLLMALTGLIMIMPLEWIMMYELKWWSYTADMQLVPGFSVGVWPVVQMLLLPPLIFRVAAMWRKKSCPDQRQVV